MFFAAVQSKGSRVVEAEAARGVEGGVRVLLQLDREVGPSGQDEGPVAEQDEEADERVRLHQEATGKHRSTQETAGG